MNKGIIMEVKKSYAIALNEEGVMDKIMFKENMKVGQKIFYFKDDIIHNPASNVRRYNNFIKAFGSIAALFLIVFTFFHTMKPQEAYAVVSLDINPSIQIEADNKFNIIKVEGVNNDGKNIDFSDIKDIPLENGIQKIKDKLVEKKYLDTNKDVLVGYAFVKSGDDSDYEEDLKDAIESTFSTEKVTYVKGDKEDVDEAKTKGISLGRYEASLKVEDQEIKNNIDKAPVKEITASIKDNEDVSSQWNMQDEKDSSIPVADDKSEAKSQKPIINASSDNAQTNTDSSSSSNNANTSDKSSGVLDVQPDVPAQSSSNNSSNNSGTNSSSNSSSGISSSSNSTTPQKDNSINVTPNNGAIENNTTSGKIKDDSNKATTSQSSENSGNKNAKN